MTGTLKSMQRCIGQIEGIALMSEDVTRDVLMGAAESLSDGVEVLEKRIAALESADPRRVVVPEKANPNANAGCEYCESRKDLGMDEKRTYFIDGTGWISCCEDARMTITQIAEVRYCPHCGRKL